MSGQEKRRAVGSRTASPATKRPAGGSRRYPQRPILGVGALILKRDSVLLVERGHAPLKGYWSLPGGAVETGEQLNDALRREVIEETGLEVKALGVVEIFERIIRDSQGKVEFHFVVVDYLCKATGGDLGPSGDAARAEWIRRRDLGKYKITEGTLEVIERAFEKRSTVKL